MLWPAIAGIVLPSKVKVRGRDGSVRQPERLCAWLMMLPHRARPSVSLHWSRHRVRLRASGCSRSGGTSVRAGPREDCWLVASKRQSGRHSGIRSRRAGRNWGTSTEMTSTFLGGLPDRIREAACRSIIRCPVLRRFAEASLLVPELLLLVRVASSYRRAFTG